jgi:hypothetical protein
MDRGAARSTSEVTAARAPATGAEWPEMWGSRRVLTPKPLVRGKPKGHESGEA